MDFQEHLGRMAGEAKTYTDCVLSVGSDGRAGLGSAVLMTFGDHLVAVTCAHVVPEGSRFFVGPHRLARNLIPDDVPEPFLESEVIARNPELDLALLRLPASHLGRTGKSSFSADRCEFVTESLLGRNLGVATVVCGLWGKECEIFQYPDGLVYLQAPLYTSLGPLKSVTDDQLVADHAEVEILFVNDAAFPKLKGVQPTGGIRDLHGISGSGLWLQDAGSVFLGGVVLGRATSRTDEHLIRVTPVWRLLQWAASVLEAK